MIPKPIATACNTSTFVAITLGEAAANGFSALMSDGTAFTYAIDASGTGAALQPANLPAVWTHYEDPGSVVMYVKASAGTPNLILTPYKARPGGV